MSDLPTVRAFPLGPNGLPAARTRASFGGGFARRRSDVSFLFLAGKAALFVSVESGQLVFETVESMVSLIAVWLWLWLWWTYSLLFRSSTSLLPVGARVSSLVGQ